MEEKIDFETVCKQMCEVYKRKNTDYGNSFEKTMNKFGEVAGAIRLNDKLNRFEQLISNNALVSDESKLDTLLDMASYAIMTYVWLNNINK